MFYNNIIENIFIKNDCTDFIYLFSENTLNYVIRNYLNNCSE